MPTQIQHHRLWLNGQEKNLKIEAGFWAALAQIARKQRRSVECLLSELEEAHPRRTLRSTVIDYVLSHA